MPPAVNILARFFNDIYSGDLSARRASLWSRRPQADQSKETGRAMKRKQFGISTVQIVVGVSIAIALFFIAMPKYQTFFAKAKLAEAFSLADDTKKKLAEFYAINDRFPRTDVEAESVQTETFSPPEFVREIVVNHRHDTHDVVIEVYMKDDVVPNPSDPNPHVYMAGNRSTVAGALVEWQCGAVGIASDLLPENCRD
jgi:Tfp pilus assembly protein PilE